MNYTKINVAADVHELLVHMSFKIGGGFLQKPCSDSIKIIDMNFCRPEMQW
jgi:hypothetical protein